MKSHRQKIIEPSWRGVLVAFIDGDKSLINKEYFEKLVIDFVAYRRENKDQIILASANRDLLILQELRDNEVNQYLLLMISLILIQFLILITNMRKLKACIEKAESFKVAIYGISTFSILVYD